MSKQKYDLRFKIKEVSVKGVVTLKFFKDVYQYEDLNESLIKVR